MCPASMLALYKCLISHGIVLIPFDGVARYSGKNVFLLANA